MLVVWTAARLALGALRRNLLRSVLTAFGILIGVAAVTIVVALGEGAERAISKRIDSLGENSLTVTPRDNSPSGARGEGRLPKVTEDDAAALGSEINGVVAVAPVLQALSIVKWRDANTSTQVVGSTRGFFEVRGWSLSDGELLPPTAETLGQKVCVIGQTLKAELFGNEDAVGRTLQIGRTPFSVIGVLEPKGQTPFGFDQDNTLVMPVATMRAKLKPTPPGEVDQIVVSAKDAQATSRVQREATLLLRQRHGLEEGVENDFRIRTQQELRKAQARILGALRSLLLGIALVSLVVGGIGVMNIMLVSVAERTREIGIRLAIGAREHDILTQFLIEALVLSLLGGASGTLLAFAGIAAMNQVFDWPLRLSWQALSTALITSSAIGICFGFFPARRAARLDPIVALQRD